MRIFLLVIGILCTTIQLSVQQCPDEKYRPGFHFSPRQNWLNDPNGMVYYNGTYHLYFQYHPYSTVWGPMHWGHAISNNMVTWEEVDIALYPDEHGTIFSGSAVVDHLNTTGFKPDPIVDPIVAIYTSAGDRQRQSIAYSNDGGITFTKYEGNPVLEDLDSPDFRDPKVRRYGANWVMVLATGNKVQFLSSPDLKSWTKTGEFGADPEEGNHGGVWECPDLFPLKADMEDGSFTEVWVLIVSIGSGGPNRGSATQYFIGNFDGNKFTSFPWQNTQWLDWGFDNYAGVSFSNEPHYRTIYMGWMNNWMYANDLPSTSFRGQMTIPRKLEVHVLNQTESLFRLASTPVDELADIRDPEKYFAVEEDFVVPPQTVISLTEAASFKTNLMELEITLILENEPRFSLCAYNSIGEEVCFGYNDTRWYIDRSKTGNTGFHNEFSQTLHGTATREISQKETTIRMFLDTSSVEVFADNGLTAMTSLYYSSEPLDMLYVNDWSDAGSGASVNVLSYKIWGLMCSP